MRSVSVWCSSNRWAEEQRAWFNFSVLMDGAAIRVQLRTLGKLNQPCVPACLSPCRATLLLQEHSYWDTPFPQRITHEWFQVSKKRDFTQNFRVWFAERTDDLLKEGWRAHYWDFLRFHKAKWVMATDHKMGHKNNPETQHEGLERKKNSQKTQTWEQKPTNKWSPMETRNQWETSKN